MDINLNEEASFATVMTGLFTAIIVVALCVLAGCRESEQTARKAFEAGYELTPPQSQSVWRKAN